MIDISEYTTKLEVLKEYMALKTTGYYGNSAVLWGMECWMDLQVCEDKYYISKGLPLPKPYLMVIPTPTFEEYYIQYIKEIK